MKPDPSVGKVLIGLLILSAIFFVIERWLGKGRKQAVIRKGWLTDAVYWFFTPFVSKQFAVIGVLIPAGILVVAGVATKEGLLLREYTGFGPLTHQPLWLQAIEVYVLGDFVSYWTHRLFHRGRWWPFHAVHHSSEELDWLGSVRVHPVNDLVNNLVRSTPLLLLGFNPWVTVSSAFFFTFYSIFLHANVNWDFGPLRSVVATPVFHRWHHSKDREAWDKNFAGLLPFWDILFGTYFMPKGRYPENFGIHDPMPKNIIGQLLVPFGWQSWKRWKLKSESEE